jgi:ABC-2 type transport system ATP-binding protein
MKTIDLRNVSRWYGNVVAVNDVSMTIGPGITGLLGPNGAGKTTLLSLMAGFLAPSRGELTIGGRPSWRNPEIFRVLGLVPERDSVYAFLTGADFVRSTARLHGLPDPAAAARRAIGIVDMADAEDRRIATYSKGMRQRIKVAAALVHDPEVLLLDEPFNGMDPRQRLQMMDVLEQMAQRGRTILFSSHILEEVERMSGTIQVIIGGRLAASGDFRAIRRLMTSRPHVFLVRTSADRALGAALIGRPSVTGVELTPRGLQVRTSDSARSPGNSPRCAVTATSRCARYCRPISRWRACSPTWCRPDEEAERQMTGLLNPVVLRITLQATLGRKRALVFLLVPLVLILITVALKVVAKSPVWPAEFLGVFGFSVVLPLTALIIGTSVVGAEIDDGSIIHLLATPVNRLSVVISKFTAAVLLTIIFGAIPLYLAAAIAKGPADRLAVGLLAGAMVAAVAYNAIFVMLSLLTTRAMAVGLLYLLVWEGLLGNLIGGVRVLSVGQYSVSIANSIARSPDLNSHLTTETAIVMAIAVSIAALALAGRRLSRFALKGEAA